MTKCDFCRHERTARADRPGVGAEAAGSAAHTPACIAACPTESLRALPTADNGDEQATSMPGFTDPAGCRPNVRFVGPRGARRAGLLRALKERLGRR
jgi:Fe-S-cluster-containing dehydrogenase component